MQSSKKKNACAICFWICEIYIKFLIFQKKDDPHSMCISEITDWQKPG